MGLAAKMMTKMGWKAGQGLGRDAQGITTPLTVQKHDKAAGTIVPNKPLEGLAVLDDKVRGGDWRRSGNS